MELLLSSGNPKKLRELAALLAPQGVQLLTPADVGGLPEVDEDQPTFAGNAAKKARAAALHSGRWALADDSGLEVDALDGAPGVRSARFAGAHGDDAANNALLLERLAGRADGERGARFVCALALARPDGTLAAQLEGTARGRILHAPRGDGDFGYDPLFLFTEPGHDATGRGFAELSPQEKAAVSHRGRALRELARRLQDLFSGAA
ncbi:MAG: RdgB/HAM1 family non-canonical purine NTP pyrophosphatase [Planctomycetes bacterium]|nr:RdgB/HAM1 family non-canonical purine NTP pyrophosphatase [Planctomycetota bacterium]